MKSLSLVLLVAMFSFSAKASDKPTTVQYVDLERYMGLWYEIARYPNSFQEKCGPTTAEYKLKKNGKVSVLNSCRRLDKHKTQRAKGTAYVANEQTNAELKVSFVPFFQRWGWFAGNYWILELDVDYKWVLVGDPSREYLWILSRTPVLDEDLLADIYHLAEEQGFDTSKLKRTPTWR